MVAVYFLLLLLPLLSRAGPFHPVIHQFFGYGGEPNTVAEEGKCSSDSDCPPSDPVCSEYNFCQCQSYQPGGQACHGQGGGGGGDPIVPPNPTQPGSGGGGVGSCLKKTINYEEGEVTAYTGATGGNCGFSRLPPGVGQNYVAISKQDAEGWMDGHYCGACVRLKYTDGKVAQSLENLENENLCRR